MAYDAFAALFSEVSGAAATSTGVEVAAGAADVATLYAAGSALSKKPNIPPSPVLPAAQVNEQVQQKENQERQRQAIAGGIQSTVGTPGGQAGQILNPANMANKTLLGQ
jgi:hypothetical protein